MSVPPTSVSPPALPGGLSFDFDQCIDARFGDEQVLAVYFKHYKSLLVQGD
jgi:hypothetical protein